MEANSVSSKPKNDGITKALAAVAGVLFMALIGLGAFAAGRETAPDAGPAASSGQQQTAAPAAAGYDYSILNDIRAILDRDYVKPDNLDDQVLYEAAVNGLLNSLSDSGTYYLDADTYKVNVLPSGTFDGIGATVSSQNSEIVIVAPIKNTPAEAAGIKPGDVILEVDGKSTEGWSTQKAVLTIRGPKGSQVELKIRHVDGSIQDFKLTRAPVEVESVSTAVPPVGLKDSAGQDVSGIGYIHIREFTARTPGELETALDEVITRNGAKGLILDVRGNPGGLLNATVTVADMFLDNGTVLVQRDRDGRERTYSARNGMTTKAPIIILQDRFSASASEVLAAALQDNGRATIVGETSFGKATVNISRELRNGAAIFVSIAQWLTPSGTLIDKVGVRPDVEVIPSDEDIDLRRDPQLTKAVDILKGQIPLAIAGRNLVS